MKKVVLWVPTSGKRPESWLCVDSYLQMNVPAGYEMQWRRSGPGNVRAIWNKVVKDFLDSDADYLWSVHDDVLCHLDTLTRLLSWDKPLVGALIFHRQSPALPHIWSEITPGSGYAMRIEDTYRWFVPNHLHDITFGPHIINPRPDDALVEINFTSTSCTLIHRSVLEAMREDVKDEWFAMDDDVTGGGEDRNFFEHARKAGFIGYVDRSCIAGHIIGDVPTSAGDFVFWHQNARFINSGEPENASVPPDSSGET